MKAERLLGGAVNEQIHALEAAEAKKRYDEMNTAYRTPERAARMRPFHVLNHRNHAVIRSVRELTFDSEEIRTDYRDNRKKIVVPIGVHPKTELTPDHVAVCGVAYIKDAAGTSGEIEYAEFTFAIVPSGLVDHFIQDPHDLHNPERADVIRLDGAERTFCEHDILRSGVTASYWDKKTRNAALVALEPQVARAEENLRIVTHAMANRATDSLFASA